MKKYNLLVIGILALGLVACGKEVAGETVEDNSIDKEALIADVVQDGDKYVFIDINKDNIEELVVSSGINLYVYNTENEAVVYEGTEYEIPVNDGSIVGILYRRDGGAPTHIDYMFTAFDSNYQTTVTEFSWYDLNEDGQKDADDWYLVGEDEVDMASWIEDYSKYEEISEESLKSKNENLTTSVVDTEVSVEDRMDSILSKISTDFEGDICQTVDYLPENPCISEDGQQITINRKVDSDKVCYEIKSGEEILFTTPNYDNQVNVVQEFNLMDLNRDGYDEILVSSYVGGTAGFVVAQSDLYYFNDDEWKQLEIVDSVSLLTSDVAETLETTAETKVADIYIYDDLVRIKLDRGETEDGIYTPDTEVYLLEMDNEKLKLAE